MIKPEANKMKQNVSSHSNDVNEPYSVHELRTPQTNKCDKIVFLSNVDKMSRITATTQDISNLINQAVKLNATDWITLLKTWEASYHITHDNIEGIKLSLANAKQVRVDSNMKRFWTKYIRMIEDKVTDFQILQQLEAAKSTIENVCKTSPAASKSTITLNVSKNDINDEWFNGSFQVPTVNDDVASTVIIERKFDHVSDNDTKSNKQATSDKDHCHLWVDSTLSQESILQPNTSNNADTAGNDISDFRQLLITQLQNNVEYFIFCKM